MVGDDQPDAGDGQAGRSGVAERLVVPLKPGNAGGGKGPRFKTNAASSEGRWRLGNLATPGSVQKLQMALHAKAKAEPGFRFYALYDKISRDDILAHAWAQCRSNKGAPGVDGKDFADIETYGAERWLGELALALKEEKYRPDAIRRVFIPKANGKLREQRAGSRPAERTLRSGPSERRSCVAHRDQKADPPEVVAGTVVTAATAAKPQLRYTAGRDAATVSLLRRFVPAAAFDKSLRKRMQMPASALNSKSP